MISGQMMVSLQMQMRRLWDTYKLMRDAKGNFGIDNEGAREILHALIEAQNKIESLIKKHEK